MISPQRKTREVELDIPQKERRGVGKSCMSFDELVDVPSTQQPGLDRVEPGDAENSYLVKKLRGDVDIDGDVDLAVGNGDFPESDRTYRVHPAFNDKPYTFGALFLRKT